MTASKSKEKSMPASATMVNVALKLAAEDREGWRQGMVSKTALQTSDDHYELCGPVNQKLIHNDFFMIQ